MHRNVIIAATYKDCIIPMPLSGQCYGLGMFEMKCLSDIAMVYFVNENHNKKIFSDNRFFQ